MKQKTSAPGTSARGVGEADADVEAISRMQYRNPRVLLVSRMKPSPMMHLQTAQHALAAHEEAVIGEVARLKPMERMLIQHLMPPKVLVPILRQTTMMDVETAAVAVAFAVPARLLHRS
jgi:hypothetical protein